MSQREPGPARRVVPDLGGCLTKQPRFPVVHDHREKIIRLGLGTGEIQRIDNGPVKKIGDPHFLGIGRIEHEVPIKVSHGQRPREINIGDFNQDFSGEGVNIAACAAGDEYLGCR